jgi:ubiquinone/menaquinone biosynthesis C-methylase UbiE
MARMDYDATTIPESYDRGRALPDDVLAMWIERLRARLPAQPRDVIDLGCGTGRFSAALARGFGARVLGVDPSEKMLARAAAKAIPGVTFRAGAAEAIPAAAASADLVFASMAFHHFVDRAAAARECARVLRRAGCIAIRNSTTDQAAHFPYNGYFEGYEATVRAHQPSVAEIEAAFATAGFAVIAHEVVDHPMAPDWATQVERVEAGADSVIERLPGPAVTAGLAAMRARPKPGPVRMMVDLIVFQRPVVVRRTCRDGDAAGA